MSPTPSYVPALAELVRAHDVQLVIPLTDLDQGLLARRRDALAPALVLVPAPEVCETMHDKYVAHVFFEEHGIPSPRSWLPEDVPDGRPLPRARQGARRLRLAPHIPGRRPRRARLLPRYTTVDSFVQECCRGMEFSIDVFCDLDSRCLNAIPRTMIQSKGGESIKGMSVKDDELVAHGARVAETVGIVGPANIQCFREPDATLPVTDVNPRFGGAFPLPLASGSRYPELALALARGERPQPRLGEFQEGVVMTRFLSDVCLAENGDGLLEPLADVAGAEESRAP